MTSLRAYRDQLAGHLVVTHGGRIVKAMRDSSLLKFPSVVVAIDCAMGIQSGMIARNEVNSNDNAVRYRVGVHLDDVMIDDDDLLGDDVHVAAQINGLAKVNGIAISDDAHRQVRNRLDACSCESVAQLVKNIDRPDQVWHYVAATKPDHIDLKAPLTTKSSAQKPSIAVCPCQKMSGDPEQEYFADGIAEDISTRLSQFCSCQAVALNKTFIFKGRNVNVTDVSRELNAQLIDGETNTHLWADGYDGILEGVFELHDEGTQAIIVAIVPHSVTAEPPRAARMEGNDLGAWDC